MFIDRVFLDIIKVKVLGIIINMKILMMLLWILGTLAADSDTSDNIPISPSALSGILISLMLTVFLFVGLSSLNNINGPATYSTVPLLVGKER
ncbi:hypothetical protein SteCoe_25640 [Stentor coeruleus]|uniref:Uncharacterized protein n=1 Tax=Stentor coeruleus TaxID=5963 RepID=A0A1R2BES1_9CILI|nr:hypothetical protein SteCoe_25640 [Stentor coeruleus]